jgi:carboxymethylenebutenolidase
VAGKPPGLHRQNRGRRLLRDRQFCDPARGRPRLSAVASNYGHVPNDIDAILDGACPMVASFGGRDWPLKGAAARLQGALERNKIEHDVKEYPDAGHSFLDEHKGLIGVLGVVIGASYKNKDAADARARIRAFFARHLAA